MNQSFSGPPVTDPNATALPTWLLGVASPVELALLWCIQSHWPGISPSPKQLEEDTGISQYKVIQFLIDMEAKGWLTITEWRKGEIGKGGGPYQYRLNIWEPLLVETPVKLLEQCAERKGILFVYLRLSASRQGQHPSVSTLAAQCRMKADDVRAALHWLTAEGWVSRVDRPGATSAFFPNLSRWGLKA